MNLKPDWKKLVSDGRKLLADWKGLLHKCLPYVLAVAFAGATFLSVLGVQSANAEYITLQGTRNEIQNEKASLQARKSTSKH